VASHGPEDDAVATEQRPGSDGTPDSRRCHRHGTPEHGAQPADDVPAGPAVRQGKDKAHGHDVAGGQRVPFQRGRSKLSLDIDQPSLDLDMQDLLRTFKQEVRGTHVPGRNGMLEARMPRRMRRSDNRFSDGQLT
jgi:hypothetical protein